MSLHVHLGTLIDKSEFAFVLIVVKIKYNSHKLLLKTENLKKHIKGIVKYHTKLKLKGNKD